MSETSHSQNCGTCGAALSGYAPDGLCAACLLESGFEETDAAGGKSSTTVPLLAFHDYEILEEIARGGMGVVYRARQTSLNRLVAIKMILGGHLAKPAEMKRFRAEAETAAQLQHPNIVTIHEVGEHAGQPFFSMDLVEGRNLAQLVRDEPLPSRKATHYLKTMADAVQYAHSRGVLHRDLKPSNILIDENDQPRITDFGLAKRVPTPVGTFPTASPSTADSVGDTVECLPTHELTQTGQVLGSPSFIPPEQAAGQKTGIGPASDVYSLGAIFYHCLTARPPFVAESLTQTLRLVAEQEPVAPRLLNASVPRDLETICLKCLEKDPARRYPTAQALSDDLNRFLNNEPIHARPVGVVLKLHRWCVRNKPLAISGTAILALLLVVAVGSPIAAVRILQERGKAMVASEKALDALKQANTEAAKGLQIAQFLQDMLKSVGPSVALGRDTALLQEILDQTAGRIDRDLANQPAVEVELRETLSRVYLEVGDYGKAEAMQRRALELRKSLGGGDQLQLAKSLSRLSGIIENLGKHAEAEALARQALTIQTNWLGNEHVDVAWTLNTLAVQVLEQGRYEEAELLLRRALEMRRKLLGPDHRDLAFSIGNLASLTMNRDPVEGERLLREQLAMLHRLYGQEHPDMEVALDNLVLSLNMQKKYAEAEKTARAALEMKRGMLGAGHPRVSRTIGILGWILLSQGKLQEAEQLSREDYEIKKKTVGYEHRETGLALDGVINVLNSQKKFAELAAFLSEEASTVRRSAEVSTPGVSNLLIKLDWACVDVLARTRQWDDFRSSSLRLIEADPDDVGAWLRRAEILGRMGRWEEAAADFSRSIQLEPNHPKPYFCLAAILSLTGDVENYWQHCRTAIARFGDSQDPGTADTIAKACLLLPASSADSNVVAKLADVAVTMGRNSEYLAWFQFCKSLAEYRHGHFAAAADWANKAFESRRPIPERDACAALVLAMAQRHSKQMPAAREAFATGAELVEKSLPKIDGGDLGGQWVDVIIANILLREAKSLIEGIPPESGVLNGKN